MYSSVKPKYYGTWWQELMRTEKGQLYEEFCVDHALLELFLDRIGCGTILLVGDHKAIFDRKFTILDPDDYSRVTKRVGEDILIPDTYAKFYFGEELPADGNGYVNVSAWCRENPEKKIDVSYDEKTGLASITPPPVRAINRETAPQLLDRMVRAFNEPLMPEPRYNNSEQTRKVVEHEGFPRGDYQFTQKRYTNLYSPQILITKDKKGRKVYYVTYEREVTDGGAILSTETVLRRSYDQGETWEDVTVFDNARWTILFEVKGEIYMMGTRFHRKHCGHLMIAKWDEDANVLKRKSIPETDHDISNTNRSYYIRNNKIYLPTSPRIFWADIDSDLMNYENWHATESLHTILNRDWVVRETGCDDITKGFFVLETNLAERNDELYCIMRLETWTRSGIVGLVKIHDDGKTISLEEESRGLVEMPTTITKFQVNYDEKTGLYLSLANYPSLPCPLNFLNCHPAAGHRNILCLVASPDLVNWKVIDTVLIDRCVMNPVASSRAHGFQYVTWDIDGDDMVYFVREASDYAKTFHDGEFVTLYRLKDYAKLVKDRYDKTEFWKNPYINRPQ